jgi:anti-sigma B factor antagonist
MKKNGVTMEIKQEKIGNSTALLTLNGRLDTINTPLLEDKLKEREGITDFVLDFKGVDYISSMGLRVLLHAEKTMKAEGVRLTIINMQDSVREIFEMTGFLKLMEEGNNETIYGQ